MWQFSALSRHPGTPWPATGARPCPLRPRPRSLRRLGARPRLPSAPIDLLRRRAIGAGLCVRRHRLPRLWRTTAPHCRADRPRLSPARSTRRRAPDRAVTAYPPREPHPSKGGTSPHNLRLDTTSLAVPPRRIAAPSKSVDPRPISPYNKPLRPSGRTRAPSTPGAAQRPAPHQARGHIAIARRFTHAHTA